MAHPKRAGRPRDPSDRVAGSDMKFFIDSAELKDLRDLAATGLVDGVTTNPSLIAKSGRDMLEVIAEICALVPGPVSAEVTATDHATMLAEGRKLAAIAPNVAVKVPLTPDGLRTCRALADQGTMVNVTLCFSAAQAILAAKAGAAFVSPFVGRLDDVGSDGMRLIADIVEIYRAYPAIRTEVLVASVRHPIHVVAAARLGAHVATLPPNVLRQMYQHPLTDKGLAAFLADWQKTGQSILG
jgi:transaldolase